jgi:hypothetical protein
MALTAGADLINSIVHHLFLKEGLSASEFSTLTNKLQTFSAYDASISAGAFSGSAGGYCNVMDPTYGAKGNGIVLSDLTTTANSPNVGSASYTFTKADIGKYFTIVGAGASGPLNVTITGITNGQAIVSTNATASISRTGVGTFGTDDTQAIQAAINAASAAGSGIVFYPKAIYIITSSLLTASKVSHIGIGRCKSIVKWIALTDAITAMMYNSAGTSAAPFYDIEIANMEWDMEAATCATYNVASKVFFWQYNVRLSIHDCYIHGSPATGIGTDFLQASSIRGNVIQNCGRLAAAGTSPHGGAGIGIATSQAWTEGCLFDDNVVISPPTNNGTYGIFVENNYSLYDNTTSFHRIMNNLVILGGQSQIGIGIEGTSYCTAQGNQVIGSGAQYQHGINIAGGSVGNLPSSNYVRVSDNLVTACDIGVYLLSTGTDEQTPNDVAISGNDVTGCLRYGIWISTGTLQLETIKISDNIVSLCGCEGVYISGSGGVKNLELIGNTIKNNATTTSTTNQKAGVSILSPISSLRMFSNILYDDQVSHTQQYGIIFDGAITIVTGAFIHGNDLTGNGTGAISITTSASVAGWITNNKGYNPLGAASVALGASPWTYTAGNTPEVLYLYGGTVSAVSKNSITLATGTSATVALPIFLDPGETVTVTYSSAPTANIDRK